MAERLTEYVTKNCSEPFYRFNENSHISVRYRYCANIDKAINKLGKLEDILEKYGIESVEELKDALENKIEDISNPFLQGYVRAFFKDRLQYVEFERDIWKRACELACKELMPYRINMVGGLFTNEELKEKINYFYQQAKKEGE